MGSASAMDSIDRIMKTHGNELVIERLTALPESIKQAGAQICLESDIYKISVHLVMPDGTVTLEPYDIDNLAERFPDCEVGY